MIPILTRIDQELATCGEPLRRGELLAEKACCLARTGDVESANSIVSQLRSQEPSSVGSQLLVWAMLVEGVALYFGGSRFASRDRLLRAMKVGEGLSLQRPVALSSAWLAHLALDRSDYESMIRYVETAAASAKVADSDVFIRIGLVLGDANLHAGNRNTAQRWYESARSFAVVAGDQAALGAIMYNRAAFGLSLIRASAALGDTPPDAAFLDLVTMETQSAWNFQVGTRDRALIHLADIYRARVAMLNRQFRQALDLFAPLVKGWAVTEEREGKASLIADSMLCYAEVGEYEEANELFVLLSECMSEQMDADDRLILFSSASAALNILGRCEEAKSLQASFEAAKRRYRGSVADLQSSLAKLSVKPTIASP